MGPEKKVVGFFPMNYSNKYRDPTCPYEILGRKCCFFSLKQMSYERLTKRLISHLKCPKTMPNNFWKNLIYITMTFKRNNLDRTDYSIVFNIPYNLHVKLSFLSYSSLLKRANKSGRNVIPAHETIQSLGQ